MESGYSKNRKGLIYDFDGVFYSYDQIDIRFPEFCRLAHGLIKETIETELGANHPLLHCYKNDEHGKGAFTAPGRDRASFSHQKPFPLDPVRTMLVLLDDSAAPKEDKARIFHAYQHRLFSFLKTHSTDWMKPSREFLKLFIEAAASYQVRIVSQSSASSLVLPCLEEMGLGSHVERDHVFGFDAYDFEDKKEGVDGISLAMDHMKLPPSQVIFIEDTLANLQMAKAVYPEILTVYVKAGANNKDLASLTTSNFSSPYSGPSSLRSLFTGVDVVVDSVTDFLCRLAENDKACSKAGKKIASGSGLILPTAG